VLEPIALAIIILFALLALKVPVFVAILGASVSYFLLSEVPASIAAQRVAAGVESIPLLAIPFFVAAGIYMTYTGIARRVVDFAGAITGRMRGGLAQVNIMLSLIMGGLSGSNLADAAMTSKMLVPEMRRNGYSNEFSSVVTAKSSMITPLIPPGIAMILYGSIANVSIGQLFVAGLGIGLLLTAFYMVVVWLIAKKRDYQPLRTHKLTPREGLRAVQAVSLALLLPVVIIGGIRLGVFTPTEAGAVAIVYALGLGLVYRELTLKDLLKGLRETVAGTSSIMLIVGAASALAWILTRERIPQALTESIVGTIDNPILFLVMVNIFLLVVGMFIEGNAAMIVLVPLLAPIAATYGIDEIHFAIIFIFNMAIGAVTPPVGTLMLVVASITKVRIGAFIKEAVPFYVALLVMLAAVTVFPVLSTGLVDLIY
jgi:tripartite ATP-independent transporter DctM subunit